MSREIFTIEVKRLCSVKVFTAQVLVLTQQLINVTRNSAEPALFRLTMTATANGDDVMTGLNSR